MIPFIFFISSLIGAAVYLICRCVKGFGKDPVMAAAGILFALS